MLERLYAIKRPFDFQVSLQRHRSKVISDHRMYLIWQEPNSESTFKYWIQVVTSDCLLLGLCHPACHPDDVQHHHREELGEQDWLQVFLPDRWCDFFFNCWKPAFIFLPCFANFHVELNMNFAENLDDLDLGDQFPDSNSAYLPHLGDYGAPFPHQSSNQYQQQVFDIFYVF